MNIIKDKVKSSDFKKEYMIKKKILIVIILITLSQVCFAQQTKIYTHNSVAFLKAVSLYKSSQYLASQSLFQKIKAQTHNEDILADCSYYIANCAVRLNQMNADELMERFVEEYPTSIKRNEAFKDVGDYYYENSKYAYA